MTRTTLIGGPYGTDYPTKKSTPKAKKAKKPKLTLAQLDRQQALKLVNQEVAPTITAIKQQQAQARTDAARRQAFIQSLTGTVAGMAQQYAPAVQSVYSNAAGQEDLFAKGYSDAFRAAQNAQAAKTNALLQQSGAPQAQMAPGDTGAADALYGIYGVNPASTLGTTGAAFASAAAQLPTTTALAGQQFGLAAQQTNAKTLQDLADQLIQVQQKKPSMINDVISQLQTNEAKAAQQQFENQMLAKQYGLKAQSEQDLTTYRQTLNDLKKQGLISQDEYRQATLDLRRQAAATAAQKTRQKAASTKSGKFWTIRTNVFSDAKKYATGTSVLGGLVSTGAKTKADATDALWIEYRPRLAAMGYSDKRIRTLILNAIVAAYGTGKKAK
jgi:septum formation inhibitor MinC